MAHTYITEEEVETMRVVKSNTFLNEQLQEALRIDPNLLIEEKVCYKTIGGLKGWLFGKTKKYYKLNLYRKASASREGSYRAHLILSASGDCSSIFTYLMGLTTGGSMVHGYYGSKEEELEVRRSGRTIKLVDKAVDELFTNGEAIVKDHYDRRDSHTDLLRKLVNRLHNEHGLKDEVDYKTKVEENYYKIYLNN